MSDHKAIASRVLPGIFFAVLIGSHSPFGYGAATLDSTQVQKQNPNGGSSKSSTPGITPTPAGTTNPAGKLPPGQNKTPTATTTTPPGTSTTPPGTSKSVASPAVPFLPVDPLKLRSGIGTNLANIAYWSSQVPFVDVMKTATPWLSGSATAWQDNKPLDLDANGWVRSLAPGQVARTLMLRGIQNHYPGGQYLVRYKGQGTLKFDFSARVVSQTPGEIVINVDPAVEGGLYLGIEATNPGDYVRDIVVTMPGGICEGDPFMHVASVQNCGTRRFLSFADNSDSIIFYPVFLNRSRAYSVLRFMDWMVTNNSWVANWSQRPLVTWQSWMNGVPIEVMIELCNRLGAHPWFNVPHQADNAYVNAFAQTVKANLNPALRVYVEHSNEVWNWGFTQAAYADAMGKAMTPPTDLHVYHAFRTREIGNIFKSVLGANRVVTVLGAQGASRAVASSIPAVIAKFGKSDIDAIAIAPYFAVTPNSAEAPTYTAMTLDQLFAYVRATVMPQAQAMMDMHAQIAKSFGMSLLAYEGGQHLVGVRGGENNDQLTALFIAFNRDLRIKQLYLDYFAGWKRAGGQVFVHYYDVGNPTKWGSWGALETIDQTRSAAPKFDGIQSFIEQNPVWWTQ